MRPFVFAHLLLEESSQWLECPALYCRSTAPLVHESKDGCWSLNGPGSFDFLTYFNAVPVRAWQRYTVVDKIMVRLTARGAAFDIVFAHACALSTNSKYGETVCSVPANEEWHEVSFELPVADNDVLVSFALRTDGVVQLASGDFYTLVEDSDLNNVELALCTTTFRKEAYIERTIDLVKHEILNSNELVSQHFSMHVVDNGSTLDASALSERRVTVHPNNNVGGSGGFAYGMILALEQDPPATHVLLMDDDVELSPESIKRTYNLLVLARAEYREAFVSGAMLSIEQKDMQWEDLGHMSDDGRFYPLKRPLRMTSIRDLVENETFRIPDAVRSRTYAGWWYCCIPATVIQRHGLPLPLFVRGDDAEYGIRCQPRFMTMNGICVWHMDFQSRYNAAVERYQTTRNTLVAQATTGMAPQSDFLLELKGNLQIELKKFNYTNAELLLEGFEDFLKGPEFIKSRSACERFLEANQSAEKLLPFDELQSLIDSEPDIDVRLDEITFADIEGDEPRSLKGRVVDLVTWNHQRTALAGNPSGVAIIPAAGWMYPAGKISGKSTLLAIDQFTHRGVIRHRDNARCEEIIKRYKSDLQEYKRSKASLEAAYANAASTLTSVDFWKQYLDIEATN